MRASLPFLRLEERRERRRNHSVKAPKKLIEVALPLKAIHEASVRVEVGPPDRPCTLVFQEPPGGAGEPLYQFVPDSDSDPDYFRRMVELFPLLAFFEDRHPAQSIDDSWGKRAGIGETAPPRRWIGARR